MFFDRYLIKIAKPFLPIGAMPIVIEKPYKHFAIRLDISKGKYPEISCAYIYEGRMYKLELELIGGIWKLKERDILREIPEFGESYEFLDWINVIQGSKKYYLDDVWLDGKYEEKSIGLKKKKGEEDD